jgi:RimJ/RimL family protein N-acetyltransferase
MMTRARLCVTEMQEGDLPFLMELWHNREVMRHADEFPWLRGWSKTDDPEKAWRKHQEMRAEYETGYTQLVLRLADGTAIGESFFMLLPEGFTFGRWCKPDGVSCMMGDIKLLPQYWNQGLGTEGMRQVVHYVFTQTDCQLFVVPPHRHNPAAIRVYEKSGFVPFTGMRSYRNHKIMELSRQRFLEAY